MVHRGQDERARKPAKRTLSESIRNRQREGWFPVISEIKLRSEKDGDLLRGRDPVALAREMVEYPVAGISVVTEPTHFGGNMDLLRSVAAAVDVPVLHKDFLTTEEQLRESAACGASAALLITSMLETEQLVALVAAARRHGLETLVEVHDREELRRVELLSLDLLGINNRDISVLEIDDGDVSRTEALAEAAYDDERLLVSESAISSADDVRRAGRSGAAAVLVGTSVLKARRVGDRLRELVSVGWPPP